mgnify:CR=1 FL=1
MFLTKSFWMLGLPGLEATLTVFFDPGEIVGKAIPLSLLVSVVALYG